MQILLFVFFSFFAHLAFATTDICIGSNCPGQDMACEYNEISGITVCNPSSSADGTGNTTVWDADGNPTTLYPEPQAGTWDSSTFTCSNHVNPTTDASGEIICPAASSVKIAQSKTDPNPSKDDKACDPNVPFDPDYPDAGCASEKTAITTNKLISESNSKLGAIANSNATSSQLLGQINGTLKSIASAQKGDCPPEGSVPLSCPEGRVTGYFDNKLSCVSSSSICNTADECSSIIVSKCGVTRKNDSQIDDLLLPDKSIHSISPSLSASGSCPADISFRVLNKNYSISYQPICDFAVEIRGIVVALGAFSALMIVVTAL